MCIPYSELTSDNANAENALMTMKSQRW